MDSSSSSLPMSPAKWEKTKGAVVSWMDNELRCVTAQRISQKWDLTRKQGSSILEEILKEKESSKKKSQVTYCRQSEEGNTTVFRLHSSTTSSSADSKNDSTTGSTLFALASLEATERISTAHERDMVQWREMVDTDKGGLASNSNGAATTIAPADDLDQVQATEQKYDNTDFDSKPVKAAPIAKPFANKPAKAVTAASFFAKQANGKKQSAPTKKINGSTTKKSESSSSSSSSSSPNKTTSMEKSTSEKENKKNQTKKQKEPVKVGNADEFVADEEESDDEEVEARVIKRRKPVREAPPKAPPSPQVVHGAMDAFAERSSKKEKEEPALGQPPERKRKRRKRNVEVTSTVNGYLRTEVQAVWEDIPTDEEEEEKRKQQDKVIARKKMVTGKPKSGQQMKQKSLVGFFSKKK